jgi:hypothetical protein
MAQAGSLSLEWPARTGHDETWNREKGLSLTARAAISCTRTTPCESPERPCQSRSISDAPTPPGASNYPLQQTAPALQVLWVSVSFSGSPC